MDERVRFMTIDPVIAHGLDDFDCKCKKDGKRIAIGGHAKSHMVTFNIRPETLCDMIQDPIPCGTTRGKPHRNKTARRICAMRKNVKYNIIFDPFVIQGESCWVVANMEPLR